MNTNYQRPPWWFIIIIIVLLLPLFSWPAVISQIMEDHERYDSVSLLFFLMPLYAVLSCYYAYRTYEARREISVILLCVLLLSYIGCFLLL